MRQRDCRARAEAGLKRYVIIAPENQIAEAMINSTRLSEADALDHHKVERAIEAVVGDWMERWR